MAHFLKNNILQSSKNGNTDFWRSILTTGGDGRSTSTICRMSTNLFKERGTSSSYLPQSHHQIKMFFSRAWEKYDNSFLCARCQFAKRQFSSRQISSFVDFYLFFKIWAKPGLFYLFSSFSKYNDKYSTKFDNNSVDGVLGIRTQDRRMVGAHRSTEPWWPPDFCIRLGYCKMSFYC